MSRKSVEFHIKSNDYFGTLATVLDLIKQNLQEYTLPKDISNSLSKKVEELMYLQNNYILVKKEKK